MAVAGGGASRVRRWVVALLVGCRPLAVDAQEGEPARLEGSAGAWVVPANAERVRVDGRPALHIGRGGSVVSSGVDFAGGTVEFDVRADDETLFVGVQFRLDEDGDTERVYLRPYESGGWNAVQYDPGIHGSSTWQLYPHFNAPAALPRNTWIHVRLEVDGSRLEVFVGDGDEPTLVVPRLRGVTERGGIGFWATNGVDPRTTAAVSGVTIRPRAATRPAEEPPAPAEGTEEGGLVSLTRHVGSPAAGTRSTAWARTTLVADRERTVGLDLGYSDDVTVFLNGRPLYSGHGGWSTRYPGFFGALRSGFETVWLPLRPGDNELVLVVSDAQRFGWGFSARLLDASGVRFEP